MRQTSRCLSTFMVISQLLYSLANVIETSINKDDLVGYFLAIEVAQSKDEISIKVCPLYPYRKSSTLKTSELKS